MISGFHWIWINAGFHLNYTLILRLPQTRETWIMSGNSLPMNTDPGLTLNSYRTDNLSLSNRIRSLWITALSPDLGLIVILTSCCWILSLCNQSLHYSAVRKCSLLELGPLVLILSKGGKKIPSHGLWLVSSGWMQPSHWLKIMKLS